MDQLANFRHGILSLIAMEFVLPIEEMPTTGGARPAEPSNELDCLSLRSPGHLQVHSSL